MSSSHTTILVTGGAGYIGSHTVVALQEEGYEVLIVDNLANSKEFVITQIRKISGRLPKFYKIDLTDRTSITDFVREHPEIKGIIHFAASKSVSESVSNPLAYYDNNLNGLINLLYSFEDKEIAFVFSSSCTVYGQPDHLPVTEMSPFKKAESPYGNTKQVGEEIIEEVVHARKNLKAVSLRYFNPVGAHASSLIGELPLGVPQNLVPFITQSAMGKRGEIVIYGDDYDTPDGTCIRDYIHVVDLAKAHVAALKRLFEFPVPRYDVFNIGTGKGTSVLEIIKAFQETTGVGLQYRIGDRRPGDIVKVYADVKKSGSQLHWKAGLGIHDMMKSAWAWEKYLMNQLP